ncbi:MAG: tetratricopeptide repeat protein [Candidatus Coatesbacteria bacterium]|nr:tetratricopeptide repeat protein [Candidatus Coatesbacteria bacterium]
MTEKQGLSNIQAISLIVLLAVILIPLIYSKSFTSDGYITAKNTALTLLGVVALLVVIFALIGDWLPFPRALLGPMLIFALAQLVSIPGTLSPGLSLNEFLRIASLLALFVLMTAVTLSGRAQMIAASAVCVASGISVLGIVHFMTGAIFPSIRDSYGFPMFGATLGHDNYAGQYLIAVIPLGMAIAAASIEKGRILKGVLALIGSSMMLIFLSITFSRGAWAGLLASIIVFAAILLRRYRARDKIPDGGSRRHAAIAGLTFAAIFMTVGILSFTLSEREKGTSALEKAQKSVDLSDAPVAFRLNLWKGALRLVKEHPLFGVGCGAFPIYYPSVRLPEEHRIAGAGISVRSPHNDYIKLITETGLVGFLASIYLLFSIIWPFLKRLRCGEIGEPLPMISIGAASALAATLVHAFFSSNFTMPASAMMQSVNLGIIAGTAHADRARQPLKMSNVTKGVIIPVLIVLAIFMAMRPVQFLLANHDLQRARTKIAAGDNAAAKDLLRKALSHADYYLEARMLLANLHLLNQEHQEAIDVLKRAVELSPYWPQIQNNIGVAYSQRGRLKRDPGSLMDAYLAFSKAVSLDSDFLEAWLNLAGTLQMLDKLEEAAEAYRRAIEISPDDAFATSKLAETLMALDRPEEAQAALEAALKNAPDNPNILNNLGAILRSQGKYDDAIAVFERAASLPGNIFQPHLNLAQIYEERGEIDKAIHYYKMALRAKPDLGPAIDGLNRLEKAKRE